MKNIKDSLKENFKKTISIIIFPKFLQERDHYFLLNYPRLWLFKLHYIFYYAILVNIVFFLLALVLPIQQFYSFSNIWIFLFSLMSILFIFAYFEDFNVGKRYSILDKSNGYLELIIYFIALLMICSVSIFFPLLIEFKVQVQFPQNELSVDFLALSSISQHKMLEESSDNKSVDIYIQQLKEYINSQEFKKQQETSIFSVLYDNEEKAKTLYIENNNDITHKEKLNNLQVFILKNKRLRNLLKSSVSLENLILLESNLDYTYNTFYNGTFGDIINKFFIKELNVNVKNNKDVSSISAIFNDFLNKKDDELIRKTFENSVFAKLVESIRNDNKILIISTIDKYLGQEIKPLSIEQKIDKAISNASNIYEIFYYQNFILKNLLINYFLCAYFTLIAFLTVNTSFYKGIMLMFTFLIPFAIAPIFIPVIQFLNFFFGFSKIYLEIKLFIFIFLPTLFLFYQTINILSIKNFSLLKEVYLIMLPFAVDISAYFIISWIDNQFFSNNISLNTKLFISSLAHLPFIPYLKSRLVRQLSLPYIDP